MTGSSLWLIPASLLLLAYLPALRAVTKGDTNMRIVGLLFATGVTTTELFLLVGALGRLTFSDMMIAAALTSFAGSIFLIRMYARWMS
ncbi:MAG: hypothetical protein WBX15_08575 [Thermoanaerobaculia bacterium]